MFSIPMLSRFSLLAFGAALAQSQAESITGMVL
ncbi:hypothetical protein ACVWZX_000794 [Deinococcus sp. UYEF24]